MRATLFLFLFAVVAAGSAAAAEAPPGTAATDYLALRGNSGAAAGGTEFNVFRRRSAGAGGEFSRLPGYLAWKNTCRPVARMAAGGSFELGIGIGGGFADVTPYVLLPSPVEAGWLELLAAEFSPPADKRAGKLGNG